VSSSRPSAPTTRRRFSTLIRAASSSAVFTERLHAEDILISMDGKGCWRDNVFVERLWKTIK
jgi:putative transposase